MEKPFPEVDMNPVEVAERTLSRIDALDGRVEAWIEVDRDGVKARARELASSGAGSLPLYGVPVGLKDIFDVAGIPTRLGTRPFAHYLPERDATVVTRLRAAGAIIAGKTATTEFAHRDPPRTRNPWNLEHTPGGSSSGSAAAVAAGMVPLALGSQTIGSTLRPAAFCGIVGLKPTHGRISAHGVFPLAPSFDHVGIICHSVAEAAVALQVLAGYDAADPFSLDEPVDDYPEAARGYNGAPRLGFARADCAATATEPVRRHLEEIAGVLEKVGAKVEDVDLPGGSQAILDTGNVILRAEAAAVHADLFGRHGDDYGPNMRSLIEAGQQVSGVEYADAKFALLRLRTQFLRLLSQYDALLLPTAPTTALKGLEQTGSAVFCAPASFLGLPSISLPSGLDEDGLPLAVQLVGGRLTEAKLLGVASWVEKVLHFAEVPALVKGAAAQA